MGRKRLHGFHHIATGVRLEQIAACTSLEKLPNEAFVVMHGEDENFRSRQSLANSFGHFDATQQWQRVVDDGDIRCRLDSFGDCLTTIGGFSNDFPVGLCFQDPPEAEADYCMVVGNQNAGHGAPINRPLGRRNQLSDGRGKPAYRAQP